MKPILSIITLLFSVWYYGQCTSIPIPRTSWTVHSFDTQEAVGEGANNGKALHAIDGNINTFWHSQWQNITSVYPHFIAIDMGQPYPINGFTLTSRNNSVNNKVKAYQVFLSNDGVNWGNIQASGDLIYSSLTLPGTSGNISFGAISARYFKLVFTSNYSNDPHSVIAEIEATQISGGAGCVATGQNNQILTLQEVPQKYATDPPFALSASTNSNLPITYSVVSGPATLNGNMVTLTGQGGIVKVKASQAGDATYYPTEQIREFEVINLATIAPQIITRITDQKPIQMPSLMPYLLHARATIDQPNALSIANIRFFIDGTEVAAQQNGNLYSAFWTPSTFGTHQLEIRAKGSNNVETSKFIPLNVISSISTQNVPTLANAVIDMGTIGSQWYYGTYKMPQSVGAYNKIMANFLVTCPSVAGGCDDWDRLGWVQIKNPAGEWVELFRYITPYGVPCTHAIDVTDYESLLQGEVEYRVYIETWGTGGWKMNLNFDYQQGTPTYKYTHVQEAWLGTYNFGNPTELQPVPVRTFTPPQNTQAASFRLVTTGHGWGSNNTGNAAEFFFATHQLKVNGANTFSQYLMTVCNPNPDACVNQQGTWYYNRAGWCPGTIPKPYMYDLTPYIGNTFTFGYQFQTSYQDLCHPNNPNCITGSTCANCNDGYNPHYRVGGYMIYKSNSPLNVLSTSEAHIVENNNVLSANPSRNKGYFKLQLKNEIKNPVVEIYNASGQFAKTHYFKNKEQLMNHTFDITSFPIGVYLVKVYNMDEVYSVKIIKE